MAKTDSFRAQHNDLLGVTRSIAAMLDPGKLARDATEVRKLLSQLTGKLKVHLAMEDKSLYPSLMNHQDATVKAMAARYAAEMGSLSGAFETYAGRWKSAAAIQEDCAGFIADTRKVFEALGKRIERENTELYALADRVA